MKKSPLIKTQCAIAGGGPAGIVLGFLLARQGIDVTVVEKWPDFFRDFRGDTIHPSTMEVLHELGLLEEFLKLPHSEAHQLEADIGDFGVIAADFSHLRVKCPFIAFIPQWDFLNFIVSKAKKYPSFHILMNTEVVDVIREPSANGTDRRVAGLQVKGLAGAINDIHADLTIGADGRHSIVKEKMGFVSIESGAPMDVLWFKLSRKETDPSNSLGRVDRGKMMIMIERNDYWQCGYIVRKGEFENIKSAGIEAFRAGITALLPWMGDRPKELKDWEPVKLLTVTIDHLEKWYADGLLMIGDAAHAMSPIGGVGINLAIQDAVAASNMLPAAFKRGIPTLADLKKIQQRREFPARMTQRLQVFIQNNVVDRVLGKDIHPDQLPWQIRLIQKFPMLRRIPARIIGIGFRPEHIRN